MDNLFCSQTLRCAQGKWINRTFASLRWSGSCKPFALLGASGSVKPFAALRANGSFNPFALSDAKGLIAGLSEGLELRESRLTAKLAHANHFQRVGAAAFAHRFAARQHNQVAVGDRTA